MGTSKALKLLLVEDNKVDQLMFKHFVSQEQIHYDYVISDSIADAKQFLKKVMFDIVLIDYDLGDGIAFDLFDCINKEIPIVIITGIGSEEIAIEAMKKGAIDYLIKDIDGNYLKTLPLTVNKAMKAKESEFVLQKYQQHLEDMVKEQTKKLHLAVDELKIEIEERKQVEISLNKSKHFFESTLNDMTTMVVVMESEGRVIFINNTFVDSLGFSREKIENNMFYDCSLWRYNDKTWEIIRGDIERCASGKTFMHEIQAITAGEKLVWLEYSMHPIYDENEEIIFLVGEGRDITKRKIIEDQFRQAQKMEAIGTLAGGIAHDFNNILLPIIGYTEMTIGAVPEDSIVRKNLNKILKSSMRAKDMVQQILTFARRHDQELKPLQIQWVLREALKLLRSSLPATIEIRQDIDKNCSPVMADPTRIHQIVMNLCTNAYHAMEENGGILDVSLSEVGFPSDDLIHQEIKPGSYICLKVSDTGAGIDQAVIDRIFDPYFTTKEEGKGTGLGLSVVHGVVKSIGGGIRVYSEHGKGTTFYIYLPLLKEVSVSKETTVNDILPVGNEHILLVDDEDAVVSVEKQMIEEFGYHVTALTSSMEAMKAFSAQPDKFDLVITDMTMPDMTGDRLAAEIVKIRPDIPVIICTGFSEKMTKEMAEASGIKGFMMKPIVMRDLAGKIREVLDAK